MNRFSRTLLFAVWFVAAPGLAAALPDTGQEICYNDTVADVVLASSFDSIARDTGTHPRQDCRYGRDAAAIAGMLPKTGAGARGFDYTKIANNGNALPASAVLGTANTAWACTKDNVTGLTWEVKTATSTDLRYSGHSYTWFSSDNSHNGGTAGSAGSNTCNGTLGSQCNTEAFVAAVNAAQLCNALDWRMPTRRELLTLVNQDGSNPAIVAAYFPNTPGSVFWSATPSALSTTGVWLIGFSNGSVGEADKSAFNYVRLVRGGQF